MEKEFAKRPDVLALDSRRFLAWILPQVSESNLLHKKMLRVSACVASIPLASSPARNIPHRCSRPAIFCCVAQGNDAYWHGVFGGLYAPHLRTEIWRNLVRAETLADQLTPGRSQPRVEMLDYDAEGVREVLFYRAGISGAVETLTMAATIAALDFRPGCRNDHQFDSPASRGVSQRLREAATLMRAKTESVSIHDQVRVKEPNLERFLRYDRYPRHSFRFCCLTRSVRSRTTTPYNSTNLRTFAAAHISFAILLPTARNSFVGTLLSLNLPADAANPPRLNVTKQFLVRTQTARLRSKL